MSKKAAVSIVEIRTTFGSRADAEACAARLVDGRYAACVQIEGPILSTYRWRSAVERSEEFRCTCKTTADRAEACLAAVRQSHPYDTPELILADVWTSPDYAAWVRSSVEET